MCACVKCTTRPSFFYDAPFLAPQNTTPVPSTASLRNPRTATRRTHARTHERTLPLLFSERALQLGDVGDELRVLRAQLRSLLLEDVGLVADGAVHAARLVG